MEIVAFVIEERKSKKGNVYHCLLGVTKNGDRFFIQFVRKEKEVIK